MEYRLFLVLFILLLIPLAQAADTDTAMDWLKDQTKPTTSSLAFSILASDAFGSSSELKTELNSRKSSENCWPLGACGVKETSLALLALKQSPSSNAWLNSKKHHDSEGKWLLQIDTDGQGTCTITYSGKSVIINVNNGFISSPICSTPTTLFDLNTCIEPNIISTKDEIKFNVVCSNLGNSIISAAYNLGSTYIPIGESSTSLSKTIQIRNTYFLDFESTLYANWVYKERGQEPPSLVWLKKSYNSESIIQNALMYILTEEDSYIQNLIGKQTDEGNIGSFFETAVATYALRKDNQEQAAISLATAWLDLQQSPEGHWAGSVEDTAAILYFAYAPISETKVTDETEKKVTEVCKANEVCETNWGETASNCPADCSCGDTICDSSESPNTCSIDCGEPEPESICGDGVCDFDETEELCPEDCKEGKGLFFWFMIFLVLLLIAALGYFYYTKFYKKGKNLIAEIKGIFAKRKPTPKITQEQITKSMQQPQKRATSSYQPSAPRAKTKLERDLEKSLAEARKILKK